MHTGFHITRLASDRWKLELKYRSGSFTATFPTFHKALETGREYVYEDEQNAGGEVSDIVMETLHQLAEER